METVKKRRNADGQTSNPVGGIILSWTENGLREVDRTGQDTREIIKSSFVSETTPDSGQFPHPNSLRF